MSDNYVKKKTDNSLPKSQRVNISINEDLLTELDDMCIELATTRSGYISMALKVKLAQDKAVFATPKMVTAVEQMLKAMSELDVDDLKKLNSKALEIGGSDDVKK